MTLFGKHDPLEADTYGETAKALGLGALGGFAAGGLKGWWLSSPHLLQAASKQSLLMGELLKYSMCLSLSLFSDLVIPAGMLGSFSAAYHTAAQLRQADDPWNVVCGGFTTGALAGLYSNSPLFHLFFPKDTPQNSRN